MITKTERTHLRSIVRQQFKVLRSELAQRQLEMTAEVENQIVEKYAGDDAAWQGIMHEVHEATMQANRRINEVLCNGGFQVAGGTERIWVTTPTIYQPREERTNLRILASTKIAAQCKAASLRLDREEADLLRTLAVGALESDEAVGFLTSIPNIGELVPAARLAELEAAFDEDAL